MIKTKLESSAANIGFAPNLWFAADEQRNGIDAGQRDHQYVNWSSSVSCLVNPMLVRKDLALFYGRIYDLAIREIEADIGTEHADTFSNVQHPDLRADRQISNAEVRNVELKSDE